MSEDMEAARKTAARRWAGIIRGHLDLTQFRVDEDRVDSEIAKGVEVMLDSLEKAKAEDQSLALLQALLNGPKS